MRLFTCQNCHNVVYFENQRCERCQNALGYEPGRLDMLAVKQTAEGLWGSVTGEPGRYRFCDNAALDACNWLLPASSAERYCQACRHNRTVPDLNDPKRVQDWRKMEQAKHRLFYSLLRLGLPLPNRNDDATRGLVFDFLDDPADKGAPAVMTGHDEGLITLALSEADDAEREKRRASMGEPYRTLVGHFRHEVGHYYWDRLVADQGLEDECRALFGDDREDYGEALQKHYEHGAPADWQDRFVSTYATTHAWEDWAETWAHYLHIIDCLDTASAYGMQIHPTVTNEQPLHAKFEFDSYASGDFGRMMQAWLPLTSAMNNMNRSMGLGDMYPFILAAPVIEKLTFIHELVHRPYHAVQKAA